MGEMIKIEALDEDALFPAYMAAPSGDAKAAIIVIPEIFGVNAGIRQKCDQLAADGYLAVAPDIFWRFAPGVELNPDVEAELQEAFSYFGQYDPNDGVKDIEAVTRRAVGTGSGRKGRLCWILPRRTLRLYGSDAHGYKRIGWLLRRDDRPDAERKPRHRQPVDAPHPDCRPFCRAGGAGCDPCRIG